MKLPLTIHEIVFQLEAQTPVHMGAQAGAQIRGALWNTLEKFACTDPSHVGEPEHSRFCPMCFLMALEAQGARGVNPPRPFVLRPPLAVRAEQDRIYDFGQTFEVGISLFGEAVNLFPYLCEAIRRIGANGVGYRRGRFILKTVFNQNPFTGERIELLQQRRVGMPTLQVDNSHITQAAAKLPHDRLRLRFLTPTQLTYQNQTLNQPDFGAIVARLLERCQALTDYYTARPLEHPIWADLHSNLMQKTQHIRKVYDNTRWIRVYSGSRRANRRQDVGGFVGDVVFEGELQPYLEWLLWGVGCHIGKNAVKGNGWYEIDGS